MKKKTVVVTTIFIASTVVQLVSQIVITRFFGASRILDNFLAAVALPTIIVTVIYSTLNDLFLPFYGRERVKDEVKANGKLWWGVLGFTTLGLLIAVLLHLASPILVGFMYPTMKALDLVEVSKQFAVLIFSLPLAIVATLFGTYYYARKAYFNFPLVQTIGSLVNLAIFLALFSLLGVWSLVVAFVGNILFQIPMILPKIKPYLVKFDLLPLFIAWLPLILSNLFIRSDTLIIRSLGSTLGEGYLVYLNLVAKVFALSTGLLTIGIQVVLLPNLVEHLAQGNEAPAYKAVRNAKITGIVVSILGAAAIYFIAPFILKFLFLGGKFTNVDLNKTLSLLPYFVLPAIGWGIVNIFFQPLVAKRKFTELAIISAVSLGLAWSFGSYLLDRNAGVMAISVALTVLLFGAVLGAEIVWLVERKRFRK